MQIFDQGAKRQAVDLGGIIRKEDIETTLPPFNIFPEAVIRYPKNVIKALGRLYAEYNLAFGPLVEKNREWNTDYQLCVHHDGTPVNFAVQIDMMGLPDQFLSAAEKMDVKDVTEILRRRIFEFENSLAMYQLLERIFQAGEDQSMFGNQFRIFLKKVSKRFNRPIALLAVTEEKYQLMKATEFGETNGRRVPDGEVKRLSGFDRLFGPDEFRRHVEKNNGKCRYLLYVRSSDPVEKLKRPKTVVKHPLLGDPKMRKVIKANAITMNVDAPGMDTSCQINDTKEYQPMMGMGFRVETEADLFSLEFLHHLSTGKAWADFNGGQKITPEFAFFLERQFVDPKKVESGDVALRAKPMKTHYGCYGHVSKPLGPEFRAKLRREMKKRGGSFVVQPEMPMATVVDERNGKFTVVDRVFMDFTRKFPHLLGGFRSLMPVNSPEAKKNRNHGNVKTHWAEIYS